MFHSQSKEMEFNFHVRCPYSLNYNQPFQCILTDLCFLYCLVISGIDESLYHNTEMMSSLYWFNKILLKTNPKCVSALLTASVSLCISVEMFVKITETRLRFTAILPSSRIIEWEIHHPVDQSCQMF